MRKSLPCWGAFASAQGGIMVAVDPRILMWTAACEMIDRAERLHRQFFQPIAAPMHHVVLS